MRLPGTLVARAGTEDQALSPVFPAVPYVPRVGSLLNHRLYATWLRPAVTAACRAFRPDILLAAWAYPDACAAVRLAAPGGLPCVAIVQGTDVNDYLDYPVRRRIILKHLGLASAVISRSEALRTRLVSAGLPAERIKTIYNGVDTELFCPAPDRLAARRELGLADADVAVLFVGNLVRVKNPLAAVQAVAALRARPGGGRWRLLVMGDGPLRAEVEAAAAAVLGEGAVFAGSCPQARVARFMQAADVLCVPSRNEGIPNVIREAFACGLPVVATRVGGIPEVMVSQCGELTDRDDVEAMAAALDRVTAATSMRDECRRHALGFSWEETVRRYCELLAEVLSEANDAKR